MCDTWLFDYNPLGTGEGCEDRVADLEEEFGYALLGPEEGCVDGTLGGFICQLFKVRAVNLHGMRRCPASMHADAVLMSTGTWLMCQSLHTFAHDCMQSWVAAGLQACWLHRNLARCRISMQ